ncbi:hypothetical protein AUJ67_01605 [Candidatus Desantisbacteria bacterium CG1_02_49_89]|nr:MAG: hypothetical protein AUJ67_01605 [Candidatus Desantisbacteria bacterium CG1_02_49_89]
MAEEDEFSVAYGLYERGLYELALTRLQAFRDSHPASSRTDDVEFLTGECYFNTARFKEALVRYGMVRSKQYEEILLLRTGQVYFFQDEYDRAILKLQEVITNFPKGKAADAALFFLGESYYKKNDFLSATGIYTILIKEYPVSSYLDQCYYSLAYCRFRRGDLKDALASLEKILKDFPDSSVAAEAKVLKGQVLQGMGDNAGAVRAYKDVLASFSAGESGGDFVLYQLGNAYYSLNDWAGAETVFHAIRKDYPGGEFVPYADKGIADCFFKRGDYGSALKLYGKFLGDFPAHDLAPDVKYWIAVTLDRPGKTEDAVSGFRNFIGEYRGKGVRDELVLDAWLQIGAILYRKGDYAGARNAFGEAVQAPERFGSIRRDAMLGIADCYIAEKKYNIGLEYYRKAVEETAGDTGQPQVKYQIAYAYYKQDDFTRAVPLFLEILENEKAVPAEKREELVVNTLYWLGWSYFKQGKFRDAAGSFGMLAARYPSAALRSDALYRLGDSMYNLGAYDEARKAYESVLLSGELEAEALYAIACSYSMDGKAESAVKTYRVVIEKYPQSDMAVESAFKIAEFEGRKGNYDEASSYYNFVLANSPQSSFAARAQMGVAGILLKKKKARDAIAAYAEVAKKYPQEERLCMESEFRTGVCYSQLGDTGRSEAIFKSFIARYPNSDFLPEAGYRLGQIYFDAGRYRDALPYFQKSALLSPRRSGVGAAAQLKTGDCLFNTGKYEDATSEYLKVVVLYPGVTDMHPEAEYKMGVSLLMSGKAKEAKEYLKKVIEKYPDSSWSAEAKKELGRIQ